MSQLLKDATRGTTVTWLANFIDTTGHAFTPANATLTVAYFVGSVLQTNSISMTSTANGWTASWVATGDTGVVQWNITTGGADQTAIDGTFRVNANEGNLNP